MKMIRLIFMKMIRLIRLMICELFISYYEKRWEKAIDGMIKHNKKYIVTPEFRKYSDMNVKYGRKTLKWMCKEEETSKELN